MKAGSEWSSSTLRQHNYLLELVSRYRCDGTQRIGLHAQRLVNRDSPIPLHIFIPSCCSPARGDLVAALGETTGQWAFQRIHSRMPADATGRRILADRPRVTLLPPPPPLNCTEVSSCINISNQKCIVPVPQRYIICTCWLESNINTTMIGGD